MGECAGPTAWVTLSESKDLTRLEARQILSRYIPVSSEAGLNSNSVIALESILTVTSKECAGRTGGKGTNSH